MPVTRNPSPSQARKLETLELERGRMSVIGSDLFRSLRALKNNIKTTQSDQNKELVKLKENDPKTAKLKPSETPIMRKRINDNT